MQTSPAFSASLVERFGDLMITARISGFAIAHYPLWTLGCLLDENWLEEDVLNSMLELRYFQHAARSADHPPIFLPTSFFTDAKRLFMRSPQQYSLNIIALRDRISSAIPCALSAVTCIDSHFSGYYSDLNGRLEHGDSMGLLAAPEFLPVIQWVLAGLNTRVVIPRSVTEAKISHQGPGSGSCGIAAENFVASCVDSKPPNWSNGDSPLFRDQALLNLLVYHFTAVNKGVSLSLVLLTG